jgi:hypothetical protein
MSVVCKSNLSADYGVANARNTAELLCLAASPASIELNS